MNRVFEYLHGKNFTLDGEPGRFHHDVRIRTSPEPALVETLAHIQRDGRRTDLTHRIDRWSTIATRLGYSFAA